MTSSASAALPIRVLPDVKWLSDEKLDPTHEVVSTNSTVYIDLCFAGPLLVAVTPLSIDVYDERFQLVAKHERLTVAGAVARITCVCRAVTRGPTAVLLGQELRGATKWLGAIEVLDVLHGASDPSSAFADIEPLGVPYVMDANARHIVVGVLNEAACTPETKLALLLYDAAGAASTPLHVISVYGWMTCVRFSRDGTRLFLTAHGVVECVSLLQTQLDCTGRSPYADVQLTQECADGSLLVQRRTGDVLVLKDPAKGWKGDALLVPPHEPPKRATMPLKITETWRAREWGSGMPGGMEYSPSHGLVFAWGKSVLAYNCNWSRMRAAWVAACAAP